MCRFHALLCAAALSVLFANGCAHLDHNLQVVEDGKFYRSGQMPESRIGMYLQRYDIDTVVNLRGAHPDEAWYRGEKAVCESLGVDYKSFQWSMRKIPEPASLSELVKIYQEADGPVLVHCQAGVHRAGTASAVYVLLNGGTPDEARRQFGLFFLGAPIGNLIDLYERSELPFDQWVAREYPGIYAARMKAETQPAVAPALVTAN